MRKCIPLTDNEVSVLSELASKDDLVLDFTQSEVYSVYIDFPTRRIGFQNFEQCLNFLAGWHEAQLLKAQS